MLLLSEREEKILAAVIDRHIATVEPVSSQQLCRQYGFKWSTATVRNVLASLEAGGFLNHPYTSAGKVPTVKAYRFLVERLLSRQLSRDAKQGRIRFEILQQTQDMDRIIKMTVKVLAATSQLLAVTWLSFHPEERLARIQLIRLAPYRLLLIVRTLRGGEFHQIFTLDESIRPHLLQEVVRLVDRYGAGKNAAELGLLSGSDWPGLNRSMHALLQKALHWASCNLDTPSDNSMRLDGASNLISQPEFDNISATRQAMAFLDRRDQLLRSFMAPGIEGQGVRVVIGEDEGRRQMPALSVVTEEVPVGSRQAVRIGVIGPRRMAYGKIIALVKDAAAALTRAAALR
ncbi:heat-inducible transcription repressor HrcA [candidate division FCPU426 bacterium]|nr:heat-inducible transcription repressor HrcA [candidate division FCPU426 bacterium]